MSEETNNMLMEDMLKEIDRQRSEISRLTAKLGKLATDNLKAQHDAAIENTRLRSELAKAREDTEKAREERNHVRVELQREENKEITRLTAEYAELKEVHENTVIGNFLDKDGKWEPMHEHYRQQRAELARLTAELAKAREAIGEAVKYLQEGKKRFAPNTTNSFVDEFIDFWKGGADGHE